jgi:uncharacterized membrane protein YhaH (DUF805 family)
MRGNVLAMPNADKLGVISGDDGQRYNFLESELHGPPVRLGQTVDFIARDGGASEIYPVLGRAASSVPAVAEVLARRDWAAFYLSPSGRVGRSDYWLFGVLVLLVVDAVLGLIPGLNAIVFIVTAWCGLALLIKRCHDVGRSGWWSLIAFLPQLVLFVATPAALFSKHGGGAAIVAAVASLAAIVWFIASVLVKAGDAGPNRFGPSPNAVKA